MTEQHKSGAMLRYLCILFAGAILLVTMSLVVRQQTLKASAAHSHSAYSETNNDQS